MVQLGRENCFVLLLKRVYHPRVINEGQFMSLLSDAALSIELTIVIGAKGSGIHLGSYRVVVHRV